MNLDRDILLSCISELKEIHQRVHHSKEEQEKSLSNIEKGIPTGCPVCDLGGSVLQDEEMCKAMNALSVQTLGPAASLIAVFGMQMDLIVSQTTILFLGIMIGRKQKEVELMNFEHKI